jgi:uncharacterized protein
MSLTSAQIALSDSILKQIRAQVERFPEIEHMSVFGSRALDTAKSGSDIDLCIFGDRVTHDTISLLKFYLLDETTIPVNIDVVHFESISNAELREHITRYGKAIGKRESGKAG